MEYEQEFISSFMQRTLDILNNYDGPHDATLLINCLLGLLVVPKETLIEKIPTEPFESLPNWGISHDSIKNSGKCDHGHDHSLNLRQFVRRLRNSVSHFKVEPIDSNGIVEAFSFKDRNGFHVVMSLPEIKALLQSLATHLKKQH